MPVNTTTQEDLQKDQTLTKTLWSGPTGIDAAFSEMMPDTVIFNPESSKDKYGKATFGSNISAQGRVVFDTKIVRNDLGEDILTGGRVYLYGDYSTITLGHKITLPNGISPVIVSVESKKDTAGVHHSVVHFGV